MASQQEDLIKEIYQGLKALKEGAFPKTCPKCQKVYPSMDEFLATTMEVPESTGLKLYDHGEKMVALFRNCACESTLIIPCSDRRDESENGNRKRQIFDHLLEALIANGVDKKEAHRELVMLINGKPSPKLKSFGITRDQILLQLKQS